MKRIFFSICLLSIVQLGFSQNQVIEKFYNKYMDKENVSDIHLEGFLLTMAAKFANNDGHNETDILTKITKLRVLLMEDQNMVDLADKKMLQKGLRQEQFEELMQIRDGKAKIDFMVRESEGKITNLLMLVDDKDSFILLSLEGNLSWKDIKNLNIDVEGGEHINKIPRA